MLKTFIFPHTKITIVTDTQYNNPYMYMSDHEPFNKMQFQQKPRFKRRDFFREGGGYNKYNQYFCNILSQYMHTH